MNAIPLTPIDYVFTGPGSQPITFAFSYPARIDSGVLQNSLVETLNHFPILRSQLKKIGDTDYVFEAGATGLISDVVESDLVFDQSRRIEEFITPVDSHEGHPLTKVVLTQTPKGSVLAVSISHALVDGFSYFHFLSSWGRISRGERIMTPHLDRELLRSGVGRVSEQITSKEFHDKCGLFYGHGQRSVPAGTLHSDRFFISDDIITSHLREIRSQHGVTLTDNDVITAILWKKYLLMWNDSPGDVNTYLTCPVDFRRILPGFPKNYFGCALCFATASLDIHRLADASIGEIAVQVKSAVSKIRGDYISTSLNTLEALRKQKGLNVIPEIHLRDPHNGMIVTNLTRLPIRDIDFGFGTPSTFLAYSEIPGSAAILPAPGGVEVIVSSPQRVVNPGGSTKEVPETVKRTARRKTDGPSS